MTKIAYSLLLILAVATPASLYAVDCAFYGTVNGKKVTTKKCTIEKAGAQPYILAEVTDGRRPYGLDYSAISSRAGIKKGYVKILVFGPGKAMRTYTARGTMAVKENTNAAGALYSVVRGTLKSRDGKSMTINGSFTWYARALPAGPVTGIMAQEFGNVTCKDKKTKLTVWNKGYKIESLFLIQGGETANTTLTLPSDKPGAYTSPAVTLKIMHMKSIKGKLKMDFLNSTSLKVVIKERAGKKRITYTGTLKGSNGVVPVKGEFRGD